MLSIKIIVLASVSITKSSSNSSSRSSDSLSLVQFYPSRSLSLQSTHIPVSFEPRSCTCIPSLSSKYTFPISSLCRSSQLSCAVTPEPSSVSFPNSSIPLRANQIDATSTTARTVRKDNQKAQQMKVLRERLDSCRAIQDVLKCGQFGTVTVSNGRLTHSSCVILVVTFWANANSRSACWCAAMENRFQKYGSRVVVAISLAFLVEPRSRR